MLKNGKISENILKRSVLKQIRTKGEEVIVGPFAGGDYSAVNGLEDVIVSSINPVVLYEISDIKRGINTVCNDIAVSGATIKGILASVLLPLGSEERDIKNIMSYLETEAKVLDINIIGGHTEVLDAVNKPVITLSGIGEVRKEDLICMRNAKPSDDIILTKWVGLEGTSIIAKDKEESLKNKFSMAFVDTACDFSKYLSIVEEANIVKKLSISGMHNASRDGIFANLWEIGEAARCGLEVDLLSIPLRQETVEICEEYSINPYELLSGGCLIITASNGEDIVRTLMSEGINAKVIGKLTEGNDRVLVNGDERRFLEPPKTDEIYKIR